MLDFFIRNTLYMIRYTFFFLNSFLGFGGFKCPNCRAQRDGEQGRTIGDIAEKKSRGRGKTFYACTRYPDCEFLMNTKPTSEDELSKAYEAWKNKPPAKNKKKNKKFTPK